MLKITPLFSRLYIQFLIRSFPSQFHIKEAHHKCVPLSKNILFLLSRPLRFLNKMKTLIESVNNIFAQIFIWYSFKNCHCFITCTKRSWYDAITNLVRTFFRVNFIFLFIFVSTVIVTSILLRIRLDNYHKPYSIGKINISASKSFHFFFEFRLIVCNLFKSKNPLLVQLQISTSI